MKYNLENDPICTGGSRTAPTFAHNPAPTVKPKSVGRLIGAFKTVSTKQINQIRNTPGISVWQRNYYEHIIRDEQSLENIRNYITRNPAKWAEDENNIPPLEREYEQ
jgi:putative transposase